MINVIKRTWLLWVLYLLALIPVLYVLVMEPKVATLLWINGHHTPLLDGLFKYFTHLGDGLFYIALIVALFFWNRRAGWVALLSYALTSIVAQVMKNYFFESALRPRAVIKDDAQLHFINGVEVFYLSSFPSGHTTSAFSIALLMSYLFPRKIFMVIFFLCAAGVGYSRMYLAEHFLTDVVAGSAIGMVFTLVSIALLEGIKKRQSMVK